MSTFKLNSDNKIIDIANLNTISTGNRNYKKGRMLALKWSTIPIISIEFKVLM